MASLTIFREKVHGGEGEVRQGLREARGQQGVRSHSNQTASLLLKEFLKGLPYSKLLKI